MADSGSNRHQQQSPRPRWGSLVNERIFLELLDGDHANRFEPEATSLKLVNSNLYARRHSAHTAAITNRNEYPTTETYKQEKQVSMPPPIPQRPPAVPKRNCVPASVKRLVDSQPQYQSRLQPTTEKSAAQPPPIPPSSKNRQLPPIPTTYKLPTPLTPPPLRSQEQQLLLQMNSKFVHDCPVIEQSSKPRENDLPSSTVPTNNNKHYNQEPAADVKSGTKCPAGTQQQTTITKNDQPQIRQDSSISSDSFSQTSSPSYTTKTMETPLLPPPAKTHGKRRGTVSAISVAAAVGARRNRTGSHHVATVVADDETGNANAITKSASTPASLQTVVKFHDGSNMSLHHKIIRDMKRPSSVYDRRLRLRFRFAQLVLNAVALFAIGAGMAVYFRAYPTVSTQPVMKLAVNASPANVFVVAGINPAPGICLPVIVNFCLQHKVPYNFTVFPNYMGHFGQRDAESELEIYDAVVDVRCYELAALFLCSLFVPKCGNHGSVIRPCRNICQETKRRCGFFLDVFGLTLPDYLDCGLFPDYTNKTNCVGHQEFVKAKMRAQKPVCPSGFQCDRRRCIPKDWLCDGHIDCQDQTDELSCNKCGEGMVHCGEDRCITREHMCDGVVDCPWGQDERNCLRLSERNGDIGVGQLEVYRADQEKWMPACIEYWDQDTSPQSICSLLGYSNLTRSMLWKGPNRNNSPPAHESDLWKMRQSVRPGNMIKEFTVCNRSSSDYHTVELECTDYVCGKARKSYAERRSLRIVGGVKSRPGDWPFLAALLGGPEEIFYCAGVLIADQWVLTASHCVGNHSNVTNWTIQLGITRRHAHSFYGQKMKVKRVVPHPMYNVDVAHDNDVALFQLAHRVTFHEHLLPVCLPEAGKKLIPGTVCTVIGWGKKEDTGLSEYEPEVNEVEVPVLDRETCNTWLQRRDLNVTDGMICAGYKDGGKDACQGDSGGPLLCKDEKDPERWFVGGIVSWGIKCAHPELPGVYAYVPKYIPWIRSKMSLYSSD